MLKATAQHACLERQLCKHVFQAKRTITVSLNSPMRRVTVKESFAGRFWWYCVCFFQQLIVCISNFPSVVPRPAALASVSLVRKWKSRAPFQTSWIRKARGWSPVISSHKPSSASDTGYSLRTTSLQKNKYILLLFTTTRRSTRYG